MRGDGYCSRHGRWLLQQAWEMDAGALMERGLKCPLATATPNQRESHFFLGLQS